MNSTTDHIFWLENLLKFVLCIWFHITLTISNAQGFRSRLQGVKAMFKSCTFMLLKCLERFSALILVFEGNEWHGTHHGCLSPPFCVIQVKQLYVYRVGMEYNSDLRFWRQWVWRMPSSGMWRRVALVRTDMTRISERAMLAVTSNWHTLHMA
jgi:hypothetical protein